MHRWRFGDCEIDTLRRVVWRSGEAQDLPPKAYAVLRLLIEQRHRVVPRDELLNAVWRRSSLSPSVLGRTVMLARRAIGDDASQPRWIESLHGVGYRFIGAVQQSSATPLSAVAAPAAGASRPRAALLPCENATAEPALAWAELGVVALVARALSEAPRLELVAPIEVLAALDALRDPSVEEAPTELAWRLVDRLSLAAIVQTRLLRQGAALWLDYQIHRRGGVSLQGSLRGDDVARLAERLATELAQSLGHERPSRRLLAGDPFIAQAWARGVELQGQGEFAAARPLLEIVCRAVPDDAAAALLRLEGLLRLDHPDAAALAERLRDRAARHDDDALRLQVDALLAAADRLDTARLGALRAAAVLSPHADWALDVGLQAAAADVRAARWADAHERLLRLRAGVTGAGREAALARVDEALADVEYDTGDLPGARERLDRVIALERGLHRRHRCLDAQALLACVLAAQGRVRAALELLDEILDGLAGATPRSPSVTSPASLPSLSPSPSPSLSLSSEAPSRIAIGRALLVLREQGALEPLRRLEALTTGLGGPMARAATACAALCAGCLPAARHAVADALARATEAGDLQFVHRWQGWYRLLRTADDRADRTDRADGASAGPAGRPGAPDRAASLHRQSVQAWAAGDMAAAADALEALLILLPAGREQAGALVDLAWCQLELGELRGASLLLDRLGPWLREHPIGLAAHARRLHAMGCHRDAAATLDQARSLHRGPMPALQQAWRDHYQHCADGRLPRPRPWSPRRPSQAWLPDVAEAANGADAVNAADAVHAVDGFEPPAETRRRA